MIAIPTGRRASRRRRTKEAISSASPMSEIATPIHACVSTLPAMFRIISIWS